MDSNRLIIAIVVTMAVLFAYQEFLQWRYPNLYGPHAKHSPAAATPLALNPGVAGNEVGPTPSANSVASAPTTPAAAAIAPFTERLFKIETNFYEATLSSRGARLISLKLKKYHATTAPGSPYYEAIRSGDRKPIGMIVGEADVAPPTLPQGAEALGAALDRCAAALSG